MGLIKAAFGSADSIMADQWREYFYCDSMGTDILVSKGHKRVKGRSSNKNASDNIISNGSVIAVNEGQCMMIIDQGEIVEFSAEAGEYTWDNSTEPSVFFGTLTDGIQNSWESFKRRITFGADTAKDQRVYFFNLKEIIGNKYGTPAPVPFRVVDSNIGLDMDISIRCNGEYSYRITDPILFYRNVCGNIMQDYRRSQLDSQLKAEFLTALQPAFARISSLGIRYSSLPGHTLEISEAMNAVLSGKWQNLRGICVVSVGVNSVTASAEDEATIKELQKSAVFRNTNMAAAHMIQAQAEAMKTAAGNKSGAMTGIMGMNMAQNAGGFHAASLYQMGMTESVSASSLSKNAWKCRCGTNVTGNFCPECGNKMPASEQRNSWKCSCGAIAAGKFCAECGARKPEDGWKCSCGQINKGKFCSACGKRKPSDALQYACDKCGWEPDDPQNPPRFCPECGDRFDEADRK